jgi:hypothetical protein
LTSDVWRSVEKLRNQIINTMNESANPESEIGIDRAGWSDMVWSNENFRRAHLSIVDERANRGILMLHFCIFPHIHSNAPILGMDLIAGEKKITGAFIDFSATTSHDHTLMNTFGKIVDSYSWKKERVLPEWAAKIFSQHMIAAGNVTDTTELAQLDTIAKLVIDTYTQDIAQYNHTEDSNLGKSAQNRYCYYQKQNPQLYRSMMGMGLEEHEINKFVNDCLFPEV